MTKRHAMSFKNALRDGFQIAMGTDAGTPFNFHGENAQELERMVALGMSPMQAILASTSAAAHLIGIQDQVGTIEKGKLADLLLFEGTNRQGASDEKPTSEDEQGSDSDLPSDGEGHAERSSSLSLYPRDLTDIIASLSEWSFCLSLRIWTSTVRVVP